MIMTIVSQPDIEMLLLQKEALSRQLQTAYQHYYAVLATQDAGDEHVIDQCEVQPVNYPGLKAGA